jgi:anti-sigma-K factor RskA
MKSDNANRILGDLQQLTKRWEQELNSTSTEEGTARATSTVAANIERPGVPKSATEPKPASPSRGV